MAAIDRNTLGTSMGNFLSDSSGLGYAGGALLVAGLLAVLLALKYAPAVPNVLLFWLAFVLTRPLGATAGDFLTKPISKGGLALGTLPDLPPRSGARCQREVPPTRRKGPRPPRPDGRR